MAKLVAKVDTSLTAPSANFGFVGWCRVYGADDELVYTGPLFYEPDKDRVRSYELHAKVADVTVVRAVVDGLARDQQVPEWPLAVEGPWVVTVGHQITITARLLASHIVRPT